jgi:hypothetical protein
LALLLAGLGADDLVPIDSFKGICCFIALEFIFDAFVALAKFAGGVFGTVE